MYEKVSPISHKLYANQTYAMQPCINWERRQIDITLELRNEMESLLQGRREPSQSLVITEFS